MHILQSTKTKSEVSFDMSGTNRKCGQIGHYTVFQKRSPFWFSQ